MDLRPYQKKALYSIKKSYINGENKQVAVLATGLGKTVIFSQLASDMIGYFKKKVLIIAHREELLTQTKDKLLKVNPNLDVGIEMADQVASGDHHVIVASVASIGRSDGKRIQKFNPDDFILVVIDEAHHASADTYKNVMRHFGILKDESNRMVDVDTMKRDPGTDWNDKCLLLGVTATPSRNDNKGIDKIFDKVTYEYGVIKAIEDGWLSRIRAYRVDTRTDLTKIKRVAGDFNQGELGDAVNNEERNKLVVKAYLERSAGKQALVFAVDVKHTIALCHEFQMAGLAAEYITGDTPKEDRREKLKDFSTGKVKVLINCAVLTEGFDEPTIEAILMARPTQSGILFQQMIGRGTRLSKGKTFLTIIDFVDNTYKQTLQTSASLLGIPAKLDFKGQDILTVKNEVDKLIDLSPYIDLDNLDIDNIKYAIEEVDLLSGLKIPDELSGLTSLDWARYMEGHYQLSLPEKRCIQIKQQITGEFAILDEGMDEAMEKKKILQVQIEPTLQEALLVADDYVHENYSSSLILLNTKSAWRKKTPSSSQIETLARMGVSATVLEKLDRGMAARLFNKLKNYSRRERRTRFQGQII